MSPLHINRQRVQAQAARDALRDHIVQLTPSQQRDFIHLALELIAERDLVSEADIARYAPPPTPSQRGMMH